MCEVATTEKSATLTAFGRAPRRGCRHAGCSSLRAEVLVKRTLFACLALVAPACTDEAPPKPIDHEVLPDPGIGTITSRTQVVHLRPQAAYFDSLDDQFGLGAHEAQLRGMIRAYVRRAFAAYDLAVVIDDVELAGIDPQQVLTIDFYGTDPSGALLTNYDNESAPKDVGNLVRNEHLGGFDQGSADDGYPGQGGVFIGSMFGAYSTGGARATLDPSAHWFDDVFAPYAPALGGTAPEVADERVLASLGVLAAFAGAEATHLVGHAVGLPNGPYFHNEGDNGCVMDTGAARSFAERAVLDGQSEHWCPDEATYLDSILAR